MCHKIIMQVMCKNNGLMVFLRKNADFLKKKEELFGRKKINVYFCIAFERKRLFK